MQDYVIHHIYVSCIIREDLMVQWTISKHFTVLLMVTQSFWLIMNSWLAIVCGCPRKLVLRSPCSMFTDPSTALAARCEHACVSNEKAHEGFVLETQSAFVIWCHHSTAVQSIWVDKSKSKYIFIWFRNYQFFLYWQ